MSLLNGLSSLDSSATSRRQLQDNKPANTQAAANYMGNINIGALLNGSATAPATQEASSSRL